MRILFFMKHPGSVRNFEWALTALAERGHQVHLSFNSVDSDDEVGPRVALVDLCTRYPTITYGTAPGSRRDQWRLLIRALRLGIDYLRYLEPEFRDAPKLRARARAAAPPALISLADRPIVRTETGRRLLSLTLRRLERAIPPPADVLTYVNARDPDLVLVTPLVGIASSQADLLRGACQLRIPTVFCVYSWDNLTNKGLLRDVPSRVTVWNEAQAREAVELHGVPRSKVAVTGASAYDHWFSWAPSRSRDELCDVTGLRSDRPFVLYVCSSQFIAPDEPAFVRRWISELRKLGAGSLDEVGVLVRPHPQNAAGWTADTLADVPQATVWPPAGASPVTERERADYFDSIYHSNAVVGINTSALIESAIVGKPVLTLLADEFADTQAGTRHFHLLVAPEAMLLQVSSTFQEHAEQLEQALATSPEDVRARNRAFLESFVRPGGLDVPATPALVEAIETAGSIEPDGRLHRNSPALRAVLLPLAWYSRRTAAKYKARHRTSLPGADNGAEPVASLAEDRGRDVYFPAKRTSQEDAVKIARATVAALAHDPGDGILTGPWLSEVGYELLYWIPFLTWATETYPNLQGKLVAVSRGGARQWYARLAGGYADVLGITDVPLEELRGCESADRPGLRKQMAATDVDVDLLERAARHVGLADPRTLHPSTMYKAYWQLAKEQRAHAWRDLFAYRRLERPPLGVLEGQLPENFVAVRFYFSAAFPDTAGNRGFVSSVVGMLAEHTSVVLLNTPFRLDDHVDAASAGSERIVTLDHLMTPATNLDVQTVAISRASAFVGTYGGLSYLAPLLGVPSLAFYSDRDRFRPHHLELAQRVFREPEFGSFVALDASSVDLLRIALTPAVSSSA